MNQLELNSFQYLFLFFADRSAWLSPQTDRSRLGPLLTASRSRHRHRGHKSLRTTRSRILWAAPEPGGRHQADLPSGPGQSCVIVRQQFPALVGNQQCPHGSQVSIIGRQAEEDLHCVRRIEQQASSAGYRRRQHISVGFGDVHYDAGYNLSGCCHAKVSVKINGWSRTLYKNAVSSWSHRTLRI